jgi:hypothetical protein
MNLPSILELYVDAPVYITTCHTLDSLMQSLRLALMLHKVLSQTLTVAHTLLIFDYVIRTFCQLQGLCSVGNGQLCM